MVKKNQCHAATLQGTRCRKHCLQGTDLCSVHSYNIPEFPKLIKPESKIYPRKKYQATNIYNLRSYGDIFTQLQEEISLHRSDPDDRRTPFHSWPMSTQYNLIVDQVKISLEENRQPFASSPTIFRPAPIIYNTPPASPIPYPYDPYSLFYSPTQPGPFRWLNRQAPSPRLNLRLRFQPY